MLPVIVDGQFMNAATQRETRPLWGNMTMAEDALELLGSSWGSSHGEDIGRGTSEHGSLSARRFSFTIERGIADRIGLDDSDAHSGEDKEDTPPLLYHNAPKQPPAALMARLNAASDERNGAPVMASRRLIHNAARNPPPALMNRRHHPEEVALEPYSPPARRAPLVPSAQLNREWEKARALQDREPQHSQEIIERAKRDGLEENRSKNYRGEITPYDCENAKTPNEENTAVHVTGLHKGATYGEFLNIVRTGVVVSVAIDRSGNHQYAKARLVFMTRVGAEAFMCEVESREGLWIRGHRLSAIWNREKVGRALYRFRTMSRVLRIMGPAGEFNLESISKFFHQDFKFETTYTREFLHENGLWIVELHFTCIRPHVDMAVKQFQNYLDNAVHPNQFSVSFGEDPCDAGGTPRLTLPLTVPGTSRTMNNWRHRN
jgi:hypothetical protein